MDDHIDDESDDDITEPPVKRRILGGRFYNYIEERVGGYTLDDYPDLRREKKSK